MRQKISAAGRRPTRAHVHNKAARRVGSHPEQKNDHAE
jgi:hypothetical protein